MIVNDLDLFHSVIRKFEFWYGSSKECGPFTLRIDLAAEEWTRVWNFELAFRTKAKKEMGGSTCLLHLQGCSFFLGACWDRSALADEIAGEVRRMERRARDGSLMGPPLGLVFGFPVVP